MRSVNYVSVNNKEKVVFVIKKSVMQKSFFMQNKMGFY